MYCKNKEEFLKFVKNCEKRDFPLLIDVWTVNDVLDATKDDDEEDTITEEQAAEVLAVVNKRYDATRGINSERIQMVKMELFDIKLGEEA